MKKVLTLMAITGLSILLASCGNATSGNSSSSGVGETITVTKDDPGTATIKIYRNESSTLDECYIAPRNVDMSISYNNISGLLSNNQTVCPSIGDVNLLVIPVHIPGVEGYNTEEVREDIEKVFFGDMETDKELGYPSVKEYYQQASYGKLNFGGTVTPWFDVAKYTSITSPSEVTGGSTGTIQNEILRSAVKWAVEEQNIDLHDYDYNNDGYLDGIWLVYDHLDYTVADRLTPNEPINTSFWNMTSWDWDISKSEEDINDQMKWGVGTSGFSWSSFDMMYTSYCEMEDGNPVLDDLNSIKLSSHTYIHETGHLLGLEDLYATDSAAYRPAGQYTMMDQNVGDLDTMSKMLLGWVTPYVAYGGSEILLQDVSVNDHQAIVIPSNYSEINEWVKTQIERGISSDEIKITFNPFSEYLLIDLYAPTNNNSYDVANPINDRTAGVNKTGVRIYHVDFRIFKCTVRSDGTLRFNPYNYIWDGESTLEDDQAIFTPITNNQGVGNVDLSSLTQYTGINYDVFDQMRLLEADRDNTFSYGYPMDENTLFTTETNPFSIYDFGMQFFLGTNMTYNDGTRLPFYIDVTSLKEVNNE